MCICTNLKGSSQPAMLSVHPGWDIVQFPKGLGEEAQQRGKKWEKKNPTHKNKNRVSDSRKQLLVCLFQSEIKSSLLIPSAYCSYQKAKPSEEITSVKRKPAPLYYFSTLPWEPIICHPLNKQAPYHITNIYLTLFS